jgi:hypothetical protein
MRRRILANPLIPIERRCNFAQTYIWSKGLFQCGAWNSLPCTQYKRIHGAVMYVYRAILGKDKAWVLNDEVISELSVICPMTMLRARRLCLFSRVCCDQFLLALTEKLVSVSKSWAAALWGDLKWLTFFPCFSQCSAWTFTEWSACVRENRISYQKSVMKTCSLSIANVITQWAKTPAIAVLGESHNCNHCGKSFRTRQSLAVHRFKTHGIKSIERQYLPLTQCPICLVEFWTRERVVNHVRYRSYVCRENLLIRPPELSPQQADHLDELEQATCRKMQSSGNRRHKATEPCVQAAGPLLPIVLDPDKVAAHHPLGWGHSRN